MDRRRSAVCLPPTDCRIDVERIDIDAATATADTFTGDQCGAATQERVENRLAAARAVQDRIGYKRQWLHRRANSEKVTLLRRPPEVVGAPVIPDVAAVAAILAKLHVVAMAYCAVQDAANA